MNFVHHHEAETAKGAGSGIQHIAEHLCRHDNDGCLPVDGVVAGKESDVLGSITGDEVGELLVRQCLDRGGVETLAIGGEGHVDRELAHQRLARSCGRGDEHSVAILNCAARIDLELVEGEVVVPAKHSEVRVCLISPGLRVALSRRCHVVTST